MTTFIFPNTKPLPKAKTIAEMTEQEKAQKAYNCCIHHDRNWMYSDDVRGIAEEEARDNMKYFVELINALQDVNLRFALKDLWMDMIYSTPQYKEKKQEMQVRINNMASSIAA